MSSTQSYRTRLPPHLSGPSPDRPATIQGDQSSINLLDLAGDKNDYTNLRVEMRNLRITNFGTATTGTAGAVSMKYLDLDVQDVTFGPNNRGGSGGSLTINTGVAASVARTTFTGNYAALNGGALLIKNAQKLNFVSTNFINNFSNGTGGAVCFSGYSLPIPTATFQGCSFQNNEAATSGGAVGIIAKSSQISFKDSSFVWNFAHKSGGGAVYVYQSNHIYLQNRCVRVRVDR